MLIVSTFVTFVLTGFAGLIGIPVVVLLVEVLAAVAPRKREMAAGDNGPLPSVAVLVPAHNETQGMLPTLESIKSQLRAGDRLVVVADNCTDDTAAIAAGAGAEVVERNDLNRIGKGYALDYGLRHIGACPPEVVIIVDADCGLADGALDALAGMSAATGRPAQALYLMRAPACSSINQQVATFAWRLKNWVRPLGLRALGLPCQLMGTGMAFPFATLRSVDLASGAIVEDLKLGLDLTAAGHPPVFCPTAIVTSEFPVSEAAARTQRERWEQGHIGLIVSSVPRLLRNALVRKDLNALGLALDLAVPPVALLVLLLMATLGLTGLAALAGLSTLAFEMSVAIFLVFVISILLAWWFYGRAVLPARAFLLLPAYLWQKCRLYGRFLSGKRATQWIRTDRQ